MKEIISVSRDEAERLGNDFIGTEHLLLGLIHHDYNTAARILKSFKVDLQGIVDKMEQTIKSDKASKKALPLNASAEKTILGAVSEAKESGSKKVGPEHLLLSILNNPDTASLISGDNQ